MKNERSAIDIALDLNQMNTIELITKYLAEFQNDTHYAHLFHYNLVDMV